MKTIAITIDEPTLRGIVKVAERGRGGKRLSRSEVIRLALQDFLQRFEQREREERDRAILARSRGKLQKELAALVREQAQP